jgi:hypothetical protein
MRPQAEVRQFGRSHNPKVAGSNPAPATRKPASRHDAAALNGVHGWAEHAAFDTMFPTLREARAITSLNAHVGVEPAWDSRDDEPIQRLLRNLASWAAGVLMSEKALDGES